MTEVLTVKLSACLTDKARALLAALREAETNLALIWREPYEEYDPKQSLDWANRQVKAARVYRALQDQL